MLSLIRRSLTQEFPAQEETKGPDFAAPDWREIHRDLESRFFAQLQAMNGTDKPASLFGLDMREARNLYKEYTEFADRHDRLADIRKYLDQLSNNQIAAIMHLDNIRGMLRTASHVIAERNLQNLNNGTETFDREARQVGIASDLRTMKGLGVTRRAITRFLNNIKIWQTFTPHPTRDKNAEGEKLFRELTGAAENKPYEERGAEMTSIIDRMLVTRLTPDKKDTLAKETQDGLDAEDTYVEGMLDYLEDLQTSLDEVYGSDYGPVDLTAADMNIDIAPRDWYSGDADGKYVPAPILLGKRVRSACRAVDRYLETLESVPPQDREKLAETIKVFRQFKEKLDRLQARTADLEIRYGKKGNECWNDPEFITAKQEFARVFTEAEYKGRQYERGPELTKDLMKDLCDMLKEDNSDELKRAARRTILRHRQTGIAMGRQEIRHNSGDYRAIFDNLYKYLHEHHPDVLKKAGLGDFGNLKNFTPKNEAILLKHVMENHGDQMKDWLFAANKDGWSRDVLERFSVIHECFNHNRTGAAIIAEAQPISPVLQQVMADAFGIKNMVHVALNEDAETIKHAAENLALYSDVFGKKNVTSRVGQVPGEDKSTGMYFCVMDPQSDSQRGNGIAIKPEQHTTRKNLLARAIETGISIFVKRGTGASPGRGGMSALAEQRLFAYMLQEMGLLDNRKNRDLLRQMASFTSLTVQGRDVAMRYGTNGQNYDGISGMIKEMMGAVLVINGKVKPDIMAPKPPEYSENMLEIKAKIEEVARQRFQLMRGKTSDRDLGEKRLDIYARETSALQMSGAAGVGARQPARDEAPKKENPDQIDVTEHRAIGSNIALENSESLFDSSYTLGYLLRHIHEAYQAGKITRKDLINFRNDPLYRDHILPNAFAALAAADYEHGFDVIFKDGRKVDVGTVLDLNQQGYNDFNGKNGKNGNGCSKDNIAFHNVLAYDALEAAAYMEALFETDSEPGWKRGLKKIFGRARDNAVERKGFDRSPDEIIASLYKREDRLNALKFGKNTLAAFPIIEEVRDGSPDRRTARAAMHVMEDRVESGLIDTKTEEGKSLMHHIACARRTWGPINMSLLLDRMGFGARQQPLFDLIRERV